MRCSPSGARTLEIIAQSKADGSITLDLVPTRQHRPAEILSIHATYIIPEALSPKLNGRKALYQMHYLRHLVIISGSGQVRDMLGGGAAEPQGQAAGSSAITDILTSPMAKAALAGIAAMVVKRVMARPS
jgi:hypothetical protein